MNLKKMMRDAQRMQEKLQAELADLRVSATAGGGVVSATMNGARTLYEPKRQPIELGVLREGLLADLIVVNENPLANFKVLYATGWPKLDEASGEVRRTKGILWTIKDGIVYDAHKLLADVREMVQQQKRERAAAEASSTGQDR